jgi:hypothetical protein
LYDRYQLEFDPPVDIAIVLGDQWGDRTEAGFRRGGLGGYPFGQGVYYISGISHTFETVAAARVSQFWGSGTNALTQEADPEGGRDRARELLEFAKYTLHLVLDEIILRNKDYVALVTGDVYHHKTYYMGLVDKNDKVTFYEGTVNEESSKPKILISGLNIFLRKLIDISFIYSSLNGLLWTVSVHR